ncbi:hypothetical protein [Robertkochia solimangrovi]|uniref:hypothetical protein n=1 Tax=Robertkochia solimangrovi TaxID=2213046 RepID=UPI00117CC160|nr:hypothetical protein [Robertkochia solimangrovi]TRZ43566.1 hypothetical protein DMZ48_09085 [Robertkochia solimangrovi]
MKTKHHLITSGILLILILGFGVTHNERKSTIVKPNLTWSERSLSWDDFTEVSYLEDEYVATIYSGISCPRLITDTNNRVFAYMDPNQSEKLKDEYDSYNVLTHEQYHFNITEYCARLLRRDIVTLGMNGLNYAVMDSLRLKYNTLRDSLQNQYDTEADHNADTPKQRFWELQIDDWLRQTAYYGDENIQHYRRYSSNSSKYYRKIYVTHDGTILYSYPADDYDFENNEVYEIHNASAWVKEIRFYKNGTLVNGGYFETAITRIIKNRDGEIEFRLLNSDGTFNTKLKNYRHRSVKTSDDERLIEFLDAKDQKVSPFNYSQIKWVYNAVDSTYVSSYLDKKGKSVADEHGIFHSRIKLDGSGHTISVENLDHKLQLVLDKDLIGRSEFEYNMQHRKIAYRMYDDQGRPAKYLSDFNLKYEYDERGNVIQVSSLDEDGQLTYDDNGASIYEYRYDRNDREISEKRFNVNHEPIIANDDIFERVTAYDDLGRKRYEATYYPGYVLRYDDYKWGGTRYEYMGDSIVRQLNLDAYGNIIENTNNVAIIESKKDASGNLLMERYFGADENPAKTPDGICTYTFNRNAEGYAREKRSLDSLGINIANVDGVARYEYDFDDHGNVIQQTEYTATEEEGIKSIIKFKYDSRDRLIESRIFNGTGEPILAEGVHMTRKSYDKWGNETILQKYGIDSKLIEGACTSKKYYNAYGSLLKIAFFDKHGRRAREATGISAEVKTYNERGWLTSLRFLDEDDSTVDNYAGISFTKIELNELGHTLTYAYFDKDGVPVIGDYGYHKIRYTWEPVGEISRSETYGADLKLMNDTYGTAIYDYELFNSGIVGKISRYNENNELAENSDGVAISVYEDSMNGLYFLLEQRNAAGETIEEPEEDETTVNNGQEETSEMMEEEI